jgi:hypothetical protein
MTRLSKVLLITAAAAALAPAAGLASAPPPGAVSDEVLGPVDVTPVAEVPVTSGVLGAQFTIRSVIVRGTTAGVTLNVSVAQTGADASVTYRDPAAQVDFHATFVVGLRFLAGHDAVVRGVGSMANGSPLSFTLKVHQGVRGALGTFQISLSNGYAHTGRLAAVFVA